MIRTEGIPILKARLAASAQPDQSVRTLSCLDRVRALLASSEVNLDPRELVQQIERTARRCLRAPAIGSQAMG